MARASTLQRPPTLPRMKDLSDLKDMKELGIDTELKDLTIRDVMVMTDVGPHVWYAGWGGGHMAVSVAQSIGTFPDMFIIV